MLSKTDPGLAQRKKRRVVHVSSAHNANDPRIFEKECHALAAAGYRTRLVATGTAPTGSPVKVVALPRSDRRLRRMTLGSARAVWTAIRLRPHLVHLHDPELLVWVPFLRILGIKVVFDSHEHITESMANKTYLPAPLRHLATVLSRLFLGVINRTASGIVSATPAIAESFRAKKQCIVQNFPVLETWDGAPSGRTTSPIYVGGISEARGIWSLLDAMERLGESRQLRLNLAGAVDAELLERLQIHPGWKHVDYVGVVGRAEVSELTRESSMGIVLFQPLPNHINSQPTKMYEYMAFGIPVLASDFPLWNAMVREHHAGINVDPTDIDAIVEAMEYLLDNRDDADQMGLNGRVLVEGQWNWDNEAAKLVAFYDDLFGISVGPEVHPTP